MLTKILTKLKSGNNLILLHHNADLDAIGCALALKFVFPNLTIGAHESVSRGARKLLELFEVEIKLDPNPTEYDNVIILDTSTPSQLGDLSSNLQNPIIIDHHTKNGAWKTDMYYSDETKTSCAEIIYGLLKTENIRIDRNIGIALAAGIIADTGRFRFANNDTLKTFLQILDESDIDMARVISMLEQDDYFNTSQKLAHLRAAQRVKLENINEIIVATSQVGSFESSACGALVLIGADIAFVGSQKGNEVRISAKAKQHITKSGLNLGKFMAELGKEFGCEGGGHTGAAGLNGTGDANAILVRCIEKLNEMFGKKQLVNSQIKDTL